LWFISEEKGRIFPFIRRVIMCDSLNGIASADGPLFVTNDGWRTWRVIKHPWYSVNRVLYCFDSLNFLVAFYVRRNGARVNGLARTTDGGISWYEFPFIEDGGRYFEQYTYSTYFIDKSTGIAVGGKPTGIDDGMTSIILRTTDGGFTWKKIAEMETWPNQGLRDIAFRDRSVGYAVGAWGIIFRTFNGGWDWTAVPFPEVYLPANLTCAYAGTNLLIGTISSGLWLWQENVITTHLDESEGKNPFKVFAYPNPFSESVNIQINTIVEPPIEIEFYDSMGNLVETQQVEYPKSKVVFTPTDRSEGVYFYRIKTRGNTISGSILKIK
ncbi:MAG: T9SS type A sorting domain-containing protein, partial [Candidatus Kapaibacteriota bacterium]